MVYRGLLLAALLAQLSAQPMRIGNWKMSVPKSVKKQQAAGRLRLSFPDRSRLQIVSLELESPPPTLSQLMRNYQNESKSLKFKAIFSQTLHGYSHARFSLDAGKSRYITTDIFVRGRSLLEVISRHDGFTTLTKRQSELISSITYEP